MSVKISVIVPVYNAASTLRKCVDSLLAQTLKDFEVLLVDDGSTDNSGALCDEYAQQDSRVKAFHKPNGGVSSARQLGIDHAQGEYTIHADPDDWVEPGMLEELYKKAKEADADMVICDFYENTYKGQRVVCQKPTSLRHDIVLKELFGHLMGATWNKLIRRACYEKYHVRFPLELSFCEDQYVCAAFARENIKIEYVAKAFYHYVRNSNTSSLSKRYNARMYQEDVNGCRLFHELMKDTPCSAWVDDVKRYQMMSKAFFYGQKYYTSKEYKKAFGNYVSTLNNVKAPAYEKCFIFFSCKGFYSISKSVFNILLSVKNFLIKKL